MRMKTAVTDEDDYDDEDGDENDDDDGDDLRVACSRSAFRDFFFLSFSPFC